MQQSQPHSPAQSTVAGSCAETSESAAHLHVDVPTTTGTRPGNRGAKKNAKKRHYRDSDGDLCSESSPASESTASESRKRLRGAGGTPGHESRVPPPADGKVCGAPLCASLQLSESVWLRRCNHAACWKLTLSLFPSLLSGMYQCMCGTSHEAAASHEAASHEAVGGSADQTKTRSAPRGQLERKPNWKVPACPLMWLLDKYDSIKCPDGAKDHTHCHRIMNSFLPPGLRGKVRTSCAVLGELLKPGAILSEDDGKGFAEVDAWSHRVCRRRLKDYLKLLQEALPEVVATGSVH